ncbi:(2Fe-2S)-binding protein [Gracilibacillus salinarum]|uniref:(2Fe-2S)-binding protein n=1 Tax=Gracilibacillus salinarum TaxID=2932255 RepID=A0ABY4GGJ4_9BACI|nr:(2Fe-2S)-binding protein [Gracilibacillus salinarum]UOQ83359.1 (2Fe-2S)-binding protein [Gracilibacillus salinarum]
MERSKAIPVEETGSVKETVSFTLNQKQVAIEVDATARLTDIIRNQLNQTGTKLSCGIGRCGACSVIIDSKLVNSCLVMAYQIDGSTISTIEGIWEEESLHPIQQAFLEEGGFQCGYCTPGMILATKALLDQEPDPTDEQIKTALSGNLCRCTGYGGIIRAVKKARIMLK